LKNVLIIEQLMRAKALYFGLAITAGIFLSACSGQVNNLPELRAFTPENVEAGRHLIAGYGCGSCHSIPGIPGADALAAPPLDHFYDRRYIAGVLPNTQDNLIRWISSPQQIKPANGMPDLGVTDDEARDIAAYLYHQPTFGELLVR
jgi:cytochrome c